MPKDPTISLIAILGVQIRKNVVNGKIQITRNAKIQSSIYFLLYI